MDRIVEARLPAIWREVAAKMHAMFQANRVAGFTTAAWPIAGKRAPTRCGVWRDLQ